MRQFNFQKLFFRSLAVALLFSVSLSAKGEGYTLYKNGEYTKAYEFFYTEFIEGVATKKSSFYLGLSAVKVQEYTQAIFAFERVLIEDKNHVRSMLELANLYEKLQREEEAKIYYLQVLKRDIPTKVKRKVLKKLKSFQESKVKHSFLISAGVGYDSNINLAASREDQEEYLTDLLGNNGSIKTAKIDKSGFSKTLLKYNNFYDYGEKGGFALESYGLYYLENYFSDDSYNIALARASFAPLYTFKNYRIKAPLELDTLNYGNSSLYNSLKASFEITSLINSSTKVALGVSHKEKEYSENKDNGKDSTTSDLQLSLEKQFSKYNFKTSLKTSQETPKQKSKESFIDKKANQLSLTLTQKILPKSSFATTLKTKQTNFTDTIATSKSEKREDTYNAINFSLSRISNNWIFNTNLGYAINDSNYKPSNYSKYSLDCNLGYRF